MSKQSLAYLMLDISAVVEYAQDFDYCHSIVHGIEENVVLVCRPADLAGVPWFSRLDGVAFWHDVKTVDDVVYAVGKFGGGLRILKFNSYVVAGICYVGLGLWRQLRGVFHVVIPSISSAWARRASIKLPAIAES